MSSFVAERPLHDTGLRRFARLVYGVVALRKRVSYSDVAEDIILELRRTGTSVVAAATGRAAKGEDEDYEGIGASASAAATRTHAGAERIDAVIDDRTVRRRVYDSLNVLAALGHIAKEGKFVLFRSVPYNALEELASVAESMERATAAVSTKRAVAHDLIIQQLALRRLVATNIEAEKGAFGAIKGKAEAAAFASVSAAPAVVDVDAKVEGTDCERSGAGAGAGEGSSAGMEWIVPCTGPPPGNIALPFMLLVAPSTALLRLCYAPSDGPPSFADVMLDDVYELKEHAELLSLLSLADFSVSELRSAVPPALQRIVLRPTAEPKVDLAAAREEVGFPVRDVDALIASLGGAAVGTRPSWGYGGVGVGAGDASIFSHCAPIVHPSFLPLGVVTALLDLWGSPGGAAEQAAVLLAKMDTWPPHALVAATVTLGCAPFVERKRIAAFVVSTLRVLGGLALAGASLLTSDCISKAVLAAEAVLPALIETAVAATATRSFVTSLVSVVSSVFSTDSVVQCAAVAQTESSEALERTASRELAELTAYYGKFSSDAVSSETRRGGEADFATAQMDLCAAHVASASALHDTASASFLEGAALLSCLVISISIRSFETAAPAPTTTAPTAPSEEARNWPLLRAAEFSFST